MEIDEEQDIFIEQRKELKHKVNEERSKSQRGSETIQVLQKDLKFKKAAIKEAYNSTCLHSDSFEIKPGKSQGY